ncbi:conserved hypothetical protein [Leishmania infantum JPCM5]|uniref:Major facilitator superfamily associated domain-containing protein n=2 Tax=Leishmania infantum TaxID=5671 RepID=A4I8Z5_LEIIN|nr:conserved hypothetical protein [Leishmania infantum JPCM5]CAC9531691.1 Major_Facilitator_Superfamily/Nucleoside_H+_symporter/LacY_proton/sugar_symporter_-_putative [Leishmania infantum]CAM71295.1 conserved hypothetical protein [Leishmania infantum JPCM5]SUZ45139.1 Major_Facilitator_Superfamily/Nucleoside_H+_symporter/LacY_proton/sugar_symporter_-_putative [Leishmania infantum]|eukprot:XP_001468214.1 conserved hypothetical protein [Leishmania infantum JPCM5]
MPLPQPLRGRREEEETSSDNLSVATGGSCTSIPFAMVEPTTTDKPARASILNSTNRSCAEVNFNSAGFSNISFAGDNSKTAASAGLGRRTEVADASGSASATPAAAAATTAAVNMMPAIVGCFSFTFGTGICGFYSRIFQAKGFSAYEIGILVSANPLLSMTLLPVLSYLADKFRCQTTMSLVSILISTVSMFGYTISEGRVFTIVCFLVMTASRVVIGPLLDQRILMMFPKQVRSSAWSYVRSYAAYGWGIGSFVASLIFSYTGNWVAVTIQYLLGQAGLAYCMVVIKPYERIERAPVKFVEVLKLLAGNKRLMLFLFASTMMGTGYSFIDNFLFLFLGELGGSEMLMGLTVILTVSTEVPLFQRSAQLHKMLTERQMMTIAMSVWAFRVMCYAMLTKAWMVLLIEPLHGVTFALMWLPSVHILARAFPPKLSSSATGLLFTFTSGVGPMIGNLLAGTLYTLIGPRKMFFCAAVAMTTALIFFQTLDHILELRGMPVVYEPDAEGDAASDLALAANKDQAETQQARKEIAPVPTNEPRSSGSRRSGAARSTVAQRIKLKSSDEGRRRTIDVAESELPSSFHGCVEGTKDV